MRLDAADLALLEIDIEALDPLGRDIAKLLIEHIRGTEDDVETADRRSELAIDDAKDALLILKKLRHEIDGDVSCKADDIAYELQDALDRIAMGREI